jgi:hypothetical protein
MRTLPLILPVLCAGVSNELVVFADHDPAGALREGHNGQQYGEHKERRRNTQPEGVLFFVHLCVKERTHAMQQIQPPQYQPSQAGTWRILIKNRYDKSGNMQGQEHIWEWMPEPPAPPRRTIPWWIILVVIGLPLLPVILIFGSLLLGVVLAIIGHYIPIFVILGGMLFILVRFLRSRNSKSKPQPKP